MFYIFRQNNSFGTFEYDANAGITAKVIVEADGQPDAHKRAESLVYFDGVDKGIDCPCCGDRWSRLYSDDPGTDVPTDGYTPLKDLHAEKFNYASMRGKKPEFAVHYLDGTRAFFDADGKLWKE
jgi:hypothetical protein